MTERAYPYRAWALRPSFKPVQVEIIGRAYTHGFDQWDKSSTGKPYMVLELFPTQAEAIAYGWTEVERIQDDLDKRTENLRKKREALNKATQAAKGKDAK